MKGGVIVVEFVSVVVEKEGNETTNQGVFAVWGTEYPCLRNSFNYAFCLSGREPIYVVCTHDENIDGLPLSFDNRGTLSTDVWYRGTDNCFYMVSSDFGVVDVMTRGLGTLDIWSLEDCGRWHSEVTAHYSRDGIGCAIDVVRETKVTKLMRHLNCLEE